MPLDHSYRLASTRNLFGISLPNSFLGIQASKSMRVSLSQIARSQFKSATTISQVNSQRLA